MRELPIKLPASNIPIWDDSRGMAPSQRRCYLRFPMPLTSNVNPPAAANAGAEPLPLALVRDHTVLLVFDVVESVRLMQYDESGFVRRWLALLQSLRTDVLTPRGGRMVKSYGDGALLVFSRVADAALAAFQIHDLTRRPELSPSHSPPIVLRMAIHSAAVVLDEWDVFGHGINLAARIAALAGPGETLISAEAREALVDGLGLLTIDTGEHWFKHIDRPVRTYRLQRLDVETRDAELMPASRVHLRPGIAVLPFAPAWGTDDCPGLGQAIADDLTTALSRGIGWRVISRMSTAQCHGQPAGPALAGLLGVPYLLAGRYRASGAALLLHAELTDGRSGELLWAEEYRLQIGDLFAGQDAALHDIVRTVGRTVLHTELARTQSLPFSRLEDYTIHLGAITLMHRLNGHDQERALAMIEVLEERHRRSAEPAAMRIRWHALRMVQGRVPDPKTEGQRALANARQALDRDALHAFAQPMCAMLAAQMGEPLSPAMTQAEQALETHPQEPMAGLAVALLRGYLGNATDFELYSANATELTPLDPAIYVYLGLLSSAKLSVGKFDDAAQAARRAIRANSTFAPAYVALALALEMSGERESALASAQSLLHLEPAFSVSGWLSKFSGRGPPDMAARGRALRALRLPD